MCDLVTAFIVMGVRAVASSAASAVGEMQGAYALAASAWSGARSVRVASCAAPKRPPMK